MSAEAFAALRRAAEVARAHDERAGYFRHLVIKGAAADLSDLDWVVDVQSSADSLWVEINTAAAVRRAIRAAIGSPKA